MVHPLDPLYRAQGTVPGPCECWPPKAHSSSLQTLALAGRSACSLEGPPPWRRGPEPETDAGPPAVSCFQAFVSLPVLRSITPTPHPGHHRPRGPRGSRACFCPPPCCDCLVRASFLHQTGRNGRLTSECPASKTLLGSYHLCDRVCRVERRRGTSASAFVANGLPQPDGRGASVVRSLTCQHPYLLRNVYATFK